MYIKVRSSGWLPNNAAHTEKKLEIMHLLIYYR